MRELCSVVIFIKLFFSLRLTSLSSGPLPKRRSAVATTAKTAFRQLPGLPPLTCIHKYLPQNWLEIAISDGFRELKLKLRLLHLV